MRSILEKAIVHLLNEEQDKAEALFHKFMVEKARKIHESLRSGEADLAEGWDDEITSEEYMTEDDLETVEDHDEEHGEHDGEGHDDEAGDKLAGDMDAEDADVDAEDAEEDADDAEMDAEDADMDAEDMGDEGDEDTDERLEDMEAQIEKLTAEFDKMMAEIEGEGDMGDEDDMGDDHDMDHEDHEEMDADADDMGDEHEDHAEDEHMADQLEDDVTDEDHGEHDEMAESEFDECDMMEGKKGKIPPQFLKNMKKKEKVKEEEKKDAKKKSMKSMKSMKKMDEKKSMEDECVMEDDMDMDSGDEGAGDEDLDDITESVMAELEKISVSMEDGKEVAAGKKITTNDKSPMIQASVDKRGGAQPVTIKGPTHSGYERETAPSVKDMPKKKNTVKGNANSVLTSVPKGGDGSAMLNKDYAGSKNNKSAID